MTVNRSSYQSAAVQPKHHRRADYLDDEAKKRNTTTERLVDKIIDKIVEDRLVDAILDK
jgi:hypothetical protein